MTFVNLTERSVNIELSDQKILSINGFHRRDNRVKWSSVVIGVVAGLILGLVAGFQLGAHVTTQIRNQLMSAHSRPMLEVVVAAHDLPAGTVLPHRDLAKTKVPKDRVPERHCVRVDSAKNIVGQKLVFSVEGGSPILWPDIEPEDNPQKNQPGELKVRDKLAP